MVGDPNLFVFGIFLWLGGMAFLFSFFSSQPKATEKAEPQSELEQLQVQCRRLREELQQQGSQLREDVRDETFSQLQSLLISFPTARVMAQAKPNLPAQNLTAIFMPLETLLQSWGYAPIGTVWERVPFDPQLHQPDSDEIEVEELVYVRFIGYRQGDRILCPAKVSRTLPA